MSQIWLHSDWHWKHNRIYQFTYQDDGGKEKRVREHFANAKEGDAYIEHRWRDLVKPEDHIWCLGDLCMERDNHRGQEFVDFFRSLPGHKRLVLGNHDHLKMRWYIEAGFQKIKGSHFMDGILMTHYPVHESNIGFKVLCNAHGHIHQHQAPSPLHYNCCVEVNNYEPIPLETVKQYADQHAHRGQILPTEGNPQGIRPEV